MMRALLMLLAFVALVKLSCGACEGFDTLVDLVANSDVARTEIICPSKDLMGRLPSEIGTLTALMRLDLRDNDLTGTLPTELGHLTALDYLGLYGNGLSGTLPTKLGSPAALRYLLLSENNLNGTVPTELGKLTSLKSIRLHDNSLTGTVPTELGKLAELSYLNMRNNEFKGTLPTELGSLAMLSHLFVYGNDLTGPLPTELGRLGALIYIDLANNNLNGTLPTELSRLLEVSHLDISNNALTGTLPTEFGSLAALRVLNLGKNRLRGTLPVEWASMTNLEYLYMLPNQLVEPFPSWVNNVPNADIVGLEEDHKTTSKASAHYSMRIAAIGSLGWLALIGLGILTFRRLVPSQPAVSQTGSYAAFLIYDRGRDAVGRSNLSRVSHVNAELIRAKLNTCSAGGDLHTNINGLTNSRKVVVFITARYMENLAHSEFCREEFRKAGRMLGAHRMIPVVMEPGMLDREAWHGPLRWTLGEHPILDFSTDAKMNAKMSKLIASIKKEEVQHVLTMS